ncbi:MAG: ATP-dependent Clp protease ATP-binding subunit [Alloprevotella sp.]|nr:ATP-dependent Clp protease ATP-binding subunit [Bacteroidales bacterium]MDY3942999.1 ATP-dependent Clp protease ATP-binding subunit [Alloprevotella sp.]
MTDNYTPPITPRFSQILRQSKEVAYRHHATSIEPIHLLLAMLKDKQNKATAALEKLHISPSILEQEIEQHFHTPNNDIAEKDLPMNEATYRIVQLSFLEAKREKVAAGEDHLLLALLKDEANEGRMILERENITYDKMVSAMNERNNPQNAYNFPSNDEAEFNPKEKKGTAQNTGKGDKPQSDTPTIDAYGSDLTKAAEDNLLDPIVGRKKEMERMAQILSRRKKNNPVLIGEPGVGKSALAEGLAQLIAQRKVVRSLLDKRIISISMSSLVAGTQFRGQFEERLRQLIEELQRHPEIILFIDEIHTIIGAGSAPGSLDAANILKPALARGEIQCIGATTLDEYRKSIEKDGALERRFQKIILEPTTPKETLQILENLKDRYEEHHGVTYTDEALSACVALTERYITDRSFPDKAVDALDEAGSRKHILAGGEIPQDIVELEETIARLKQEKVDAALVQDYEKAAALRDQALQVTSELNIKLKAWKESVSKQREIVDKEDIAEVVAMMSGVPLQKVANEESIQLRGLRTALENKVIAQDKAIEKVVRAITRNRLGLKDPNRPIGTFMFVGPTGVGKTHLVKTLSEFMFGTKDSLIRIDMSEYSEKFNTSRLIGAPPGYVGYDEGGQLTERVRRHPYSVVLLDEIEKAHPDVFNMLLQVMDEGRMTDGNGTTVDFRNTIIIMTSNTGTRQLKEFGKGVGFSSSASLSGQMAEGIVQKALARQFAPEFLNRLDDIIMFQPLTKESATQILELELQTLSHRLEKLNYALSLSAEAKAFLVEKGFDAQYGARSLKRALQVNVEDLLADAMMEEKLSTEICIDREGDKLVIR